MATNLAIDDKLIKEARLVGLHRTQKAVVTERGRECGMRVMRDLLRK